MGQRPSTIFRKAFILTRQLFLLDFLLGVDYDLDLVKAVSITSLKIK
jgi:hypothetical protein